MDDNYRPWERKSKRIKRAIRNPRKFYLIVTEGATEEAYLSHFKTTTGPEIVNGCDNKLSLVKKAIIERDRRIAKGKFVKGDALWVVFDRDIDPTNPVDKQAFNEALSLAEREGVNLAYSNDSFELWYLLHFQEVSTSLHRRTIDLKLSKHIGRTYKSRHKSKVEDLFNLTQGRLTDAISRAERLQASASTTGSTPHTVNPSTTVHLLIQSLMNEEGFSFR